MLYYSHEARRVGFAYCDTVFSLLLQMDSPLKKVAVTGQLNTDKPYALRLRRVDDDTDVMTSSLEVNPDTGRFQFASNYDSSE